MRHRSLSVALFSIVLFTLSAYAVEMQVEGPQDSLAGAPAINHCTLRKAIINANNDAATYPQCQAGSGADEIVFNFPGAITTALAGINEDDGLTGDYDIKQSLTITGHPDGTILDGADLDRLFHVNPLNTPGVVVTLRNLHIRNGNGLGSAGGILMSGGTLNLENVTISSCSVSGGDGGAIAIAAGTVNLNNCTISGNTAAHYAGGIVNDGGLLHITNSTITGNSSGFSNLTGGVRNAAAPATLRNTIIAGNTGADLPNLDGFFTSLGYNIIGELGTNPGTPTITATTGDQFDVNDALVNLGPLQNNGGSTPTHALGAGSIALDQGHASGSTTDQRGLTRPCDNGSIANASGGDGGDVGAYEEQVLCVTNVNPDAVDDFASIAQDSGANAIDVLANDTDANVSDTLTVTAVTQGAHGSVAITGGGTGVSYTPDANYAGSDSFTYTIDDGNGGSDTATVTVDIADTQPPDITASVAVSSLWPPNHNMIDVGLSISATDNTGTATTSFVVYSDEDDGGSPDASGSLLLRAERAGTGDGRVYLIAITSTDAHSNTSHECLTVVVPKSQSAKDIASVNAQAAAALAQCPSPIGYFIVGN